MNNNDKVRKALQWLDDKGWSELIDPRWTLEVYHELQTSNLNLTDEDIREALDIVIYDKPDYNPANNERLTHGMTEESPKYKDYTSQMQQCKADAEKEHPKYKGFHDLSEPHEKADNILCNLLQDLGFKEIVEIYKSFENGMHKESTIIGNTKIISNQMGYAFENEHLRNGFDSGKSIEL